MPASERVIHVAADPVGFVQDCARCGCVLIDNRGVVTLHGEPLMYFTPGLSVASGSGVHIMRDEPNCAARHAPETTDAE